MLKNEIITLLNEVQVLVQKQLSILQVLTEKYDQLNKFQQYNVEKSLKRIKITFSIQSENESSKMPALQQIQQNNNFIPQSTKTKKQEPFTIEDWQLIRNQCAQLDGIYEEILNFVQLYQINGSHHLSEAEVDEKSFDLVNDSYYGYKINHTQTGRGLKIRKNSVQYGYYIMNIMQEGCVVCYFEEQQGFIISIEQNQKLQKVQIQDIQQNLKNQKGDYDQEKCLEQCLAVNKNFLTFKNNQKFITVKEKLEILIKAFYNTNLYQPSFIVKSTDYYGQAKHSKIQGLYYIKEGYGFQFYPQIKIGLWKDDECVEDFENYQKIINYDL